MIEHIYDNLWESMLDASRYVKENKVELVCSDDPFKRMFGWGCPGAWFGIKLTTIKNRQFGNAPSPDVLKLLEKSIITTKGRQYICDLINTEFSNVKEFQSNHKELQKLKAFA